MKYCAVGRFFAGFGLPAGAGAEGRCRAGRDLPGPIAGVRANAAASQPEPVFPARAVVLHIGEGLEKQRESKDTNRDRYTVSQARKEGLVPRNMFVHYVSPASEQLLWLPDLVAHTYRRYITVADRKSVV